MGKLTGFGTGVRNEQRLAALYALGLLDTPAEPAFDRLTRLVIRLLQVPIVLVSLVDADRQFFKSAIGLPEPWASQRETPLSHSFCQYVVETGEPLVVADAPNHPLVCSNQAIPDMNVQAYLGVPLITTDGLALGALCAIDTAPHAWDAADIDTLRDLAAAVISEIELRRELTTRRQAAAALYESNARFIGAFRYASIGMALVAPDGRWLQVNQALCALVGYSEQELLASRFQAITHPSDLDADLAQVEQLLRGEITAYQMEKRYLHKSGALIWAMLNVSLVRDLHGVPQYFVAQIQDITQRRHYEQERQHFIDQLTASLEERDALLRQSTTSLRRTAALYEVAGTLNRTQKISAILEVVVDSAARVLPAHRMVLITVDTEAQTVTQQLEGGPGARHVAPLSFAELLEGLSGVVLREGQAVLSLSGIVDERESPQVQQRRVRDQAGSIMVAPIQSQGAILGTLTAINPPDGADFTPEDVDLLVALANQAAIAIERAALLSDLQYHATTDGLTQLLNRWSWFEQSQRIAALAGYAQQPLSVVLLDADHFKQINDTYGHDIGDRVLQMISRAIQQIVRHSDVVGRYGGEEFVVLLPETAPAVALQIAERIRGAVAGQWLLISEQRIAVTASLGVASTQGQAPELAALLSRADQALYAAKRAGRNCVRLHQV